MSISRPATSPSASATSWRSTTSRSRSPTGSLTALLGPSGSGKSTLLRVIAGLETPDAGAVFDRRRRTSPARPPQERGVGFVFQHYAAFKHMTVYDNVAFGLKIRKRPKAEIDERVARAARARPARRARGPLPVAALRRPAPAHGPRPRARGRPEVLLLDEPFGALDARVRTELRALAAAAARRDAHDDGHRHARPGGGDGGRRRGRRHEPRAGSSRSPGRASSTSSPANEFVMTFVGQANRLGDAFVRPHDLELTLEPNGATREAMVERVVHLGFEVRVELVARRRRAALGPADPRRGGAARARARADRLRRPTRADDVQCRRAGAVRQPGVGVGRQRQRRRRAARRGRRRRA